MFTAYGPGQPQKMFLSQVISHAVSGERFRMSDGRQKRDFVFVGDVVDAILTASEAETAVGRSINIAGGRGIGLAELARKIWKTCDADPELLEIGAIDKNSDDAFHTEADISLASELLGWAPATPFIGDAAVGHPLFGMIERAHAANIGDLSVVANSPAQ